ncbi:hypothetical protein [Streptomyces sp. NPDC090994]|uniref:hypothetical protein n=1 Tax=Streptomyces sp. NPDC090994 TaxID=3365969 RepID=UPI0038152C7E
MTSTPFQPEHLLLLGDNFIRHHDVLQSGTLLDGPQPADALVRHITRTQTLARRTLDVRNSAATMPHLHHSPMIRAGLDRLVQLATLTVLAADHLLHAADILRDTPRTSLSGGPDAAAPSDQHPAESHDVGWHIVRAEQLTALGAEDCLGLAGTFARALHQQHPGPDHRPPSLSATQHATLRAIATGRITHNRHLDKLHVSPGDNLRVTGATIRALTSRGLIQREPCPLVLHDRYHLTSAGHQALAAALAHFQSLAPTTRRPPRRRPAATSLGAPTKLSPGRPSVRQR